ncbi:hypothetical protein WJX77_005269 [Trebouxia sp. C0004]
MHMMQGRYTEQSPVAQLGLAVTGTGRAVLCCQSPIQSRNFGSCVTKQQHARLDTAWHGMDTTSMRCEGLAVTPTNIQRRVGSLA